MLDNLKFWKKDEGHSDPFATSDDAMQPPDPLRMQDPLQDQGGLTDPLQKPDPLGNDPSGPLSRAPSPSAPGGPIEPDPYPTSPTMRNNVPPLHEPHQEVVEHEEVAHPRDMELVNAKLDAIKSELDSIHQRVRKIEQLTDKGQKRYW